MKKSIKKKSNSKAERPAKPYSEFPLTVHPSGRWSKRIRNKFHYFGHWKNPDGTIKPNGGEWQTALDLYKERAADLHAGRTPRTDPDAVVIAEMIDRYLSSKRMLVDNDELSPRTFGDYYNSCERICAFFGKGRLISDLHPSDFEDFRADLAKNIGAVTLAQRINVIRSIFRFAHEAGLIDHQVRFGPGFKKPSRKVIRGERNQNGKRMFQAEEIRALVETADPILRAMILLAINCGFGQSDISNLPMSAVDLENGWIDYPRPKTHIERRIPLWPETIDAVRSAIVKRPKPKHPDDGNLIFITQFGHKWVRTQKRKRNKQDSGLTGSEDHISVDAVVQEFRKLLKKLDINGKRNFYAIRHTFETIGGESKDQVAVNFCMGHVDSSMASAYREQISDERLRAVTDTIHQWLWPEEKVVESTSDKPISTRTPAITIEIEYDAQGQRKAKRFDDTSAAKSFYCGKDKAGTNPTIQFPEGVE